MAGVCPTFPNCWPLKAKRFSPAGIGRALPPAGGFCLFLSLTSQNASPGVTAPTQVSTGPSATRCMLKVIGSAARWPSKVSRMSSSGYEGFGWTEATWRVHFKSPPLASEDMLAHALSRKEAKASCL